jgi:transglutaminase-like putative cysteine protease/predicted glutamine amidotransferase
MPNLLAMSFEGELAPAFDLRCLRPGGRPPDGWGIGYYPGGEPAATILKEPAPQYGSIRSQLVEAWEHLASSLFVVHIRAATWGHISDSNTQPFARSWGRRDWLYAHAGSLRHRLHLGSGKQFEPVGSTDSEAVFCELLGRIASQGWASMADSDPELLRTWFDEINSMGTLTSILTDGRDLAVYADRRVEETGVFLAHIIPPHDELVFGDADLGVDLSRRGIKERKGVIVSSNPLPSKDGHQQMEWKRVAPGALVIVRQGAVMAEASPPVSSPAAGAPARAFLDRWKVPAKAEVRRLLVTHQTVYRYETPVERSTHVLRLTPTVDRLQSLHEHELSLSVGGAERDYEDVFGNQVRGVLIDSPYMELTIRARSRVELRDTDPLSFRALRERTAIPLVWMPWQRHMLQPFLLPQELPDSELSELVEYAMSFVERNDYDLLDTLLDLNTSIFREYAYKQGTTTLATTPFDVYTRRRGVCQDFTNLFICLARLLGVPARYVCGYLLVGGGSENRAQSQASHAWAQVYLPEVGWKGFDPTNGVLTQTDHIRVSVGRSYVDATPTAGTIYVGGGTETLEVDVRVDLAEEEAPA